MSFNKINFLPTLSISGMNKKTLTGLIAATTLMSTFSAINPADAANPFSLTIEAPGVQQSNLFTNPNAYGAKNVYQDSFNSDTPTTYGTTTSVLGFNYQTSPTSNTVMNNTTSNSVGYFTNAYIASTTTGNAPGGATYGGAGGSGNYFDVNQQISGNVTQSTLTFTNPQSYFGLWWSAGDAANTMTFLSNGQVVATYSTASVLSYLAQLPNPKSYNGNPNNGQDSTEPFAYLNFFANPNTTFNQIQFSNVGGTGFEADNFTVASSYTSTSGTLISVPEPTAVVGLMAIGGMFLRKRKNQNLDSVKESA